MENISIDEQDLRILSELEANSKARLSGIAKKTHIPVTTIHNRIKKLQDIGVIRKFTLELDYAKLGRGLHALIFMTVKDADQQILARDLRGVDGVEQVYILTGSYDMLLDCRLRDVTALNDFLVHALRPRKEIDKTQTMIVLEEC